MKAWKILGGVALALWISGMGRLPAHQTLYHNIEINLTDPAIIQFFVTVHAPELPSGVAAGVDPSAVDDSWLRTLPDAELAALIGEADRFVRDTFSLSVVPHGDAPAKPISPASLPLVFETPEQIRDPDYDNGLPAGCFLGTITIRNPGAPEGLAVAFSPTAEKRLLLAIARPGAFPEVHDLEAAESIQVALPEAPPRRRPAPFFLIGMVSAVALFTWLALKRRNIR